MEINPPDVGVLLENPPVRVPKPLPRYTVDEYLALERAAFERHIYLDGEIIAMADESEVHGDISVNLVTTLSVQLKGKPCRVRTKDTKVRSGPVPESGKGRKGLLSYPDIAVVCGEREFHDAHKDIILNPKVIVEVLSDSTEAFDRGEKFQRYQAHNLSLQDYLLVSQNKPRIEHYQRQADGSWRYQVISGLDMSVSIVSIDCTLKLNDVYDRVEFEDEPSNDE